MRLISGGDLREKMGQRLPELDVKNYMRMALKGIDYCHKNNVTHRDLKPDNLMLDQDGNLKIVDFGLSYQL